MGSSKTWDTSTPTFGLGKSLDMDEDLGVNTGRDTGWVTCMGQVMGSDSGSSMGIGIGSGMDIDSDLGLGMGKEIGLDTGMDTDRGIDMATGIGTGMVTDMDIDIDIGRVSDWVIGSGLDWGSGKSGYRTLMSSTKLGADRWLCPKGKSRGIFDISYIS